MANAWQTHTVEFASAEGLTQNETAVRVLDHEDDEGNRVAAIQRRIDEIDNDENSHAELLSLRHEMTNKIKEDPGYKFLMQVSAFSKLKLDHIINGDQEVRRNIELEAACGGSCPVPAHVDRTWLDVPEVSGTLQLSATVYGHIKEAEMLVRNRCPGISLKVLVESGQYQTPFARLVSLRIILSGVLTGLGNRRDRTWARVHQEQQMLLKQFDRIVLRAEHDWTRPV